MNRYKGDPYWTTARYVSKCACGNHGIVKGDSIFYYPSTRSCYGGNCADRAARDFESMAADEEMMGG